MTASRRWLVLLLVFAIALLAACSGDDDDDSSSDGGGDSFGGEDEGPDDNRGGDNGDVNEDGDVSGEREMPDFGPLEDAERLEASAGEFEEWYQAWHAVPPFGSLFEIQFTDPTNTEVYYYEGRWDSTLWTGVYAGTECLRYHVTGDEDAQENAIGALTALHHHKAVTQIQGLVSRFVVPNEWIYAHDHQDPNDNNCHDGEGDYEGTRWCENTSRDQYTGYWYAQALCYDFLDDEETREMIRADVRDVIDWFQETDWHILRQDGEVSTAAGWIDWTKRLDWTLIAAHVLEDPELYALYEQMFERYRPVLWSDAWSLYNRYHDYYGNNLRWMTVFNLYRLEWDPARYRAYVDVMRDRARPYIGWTHNPWTDLFWLYGCAGNASCDDPQALADYIRTDIGQFGTAPRRHVPVVGIPEIEPDPLPGRWNAFVDRLVEMGLPEYLAGELRFDEQPLYAQEVRYQCFSDFIWQRSPFRNSCGGGDGSFVSAGVDYLAVYWLGRWMNVLPPGNPDFPGWRGGAPEAAE